VQLLHDDQGINCPKRFPFSDSFRREDIPDSRRNGIVRQDVSTDVHDRADGPWF
jgi:hypothetical protein